MSQNWREELDKMLEDLAHHCRPNYNLPRKMSDQDKFGTRSEPVMGKCAKCGDATPTAELNADEWCGLCAAIDRLRGTLEKRGIIHPQLFPEGNRELPPGDR